MSAATKKTTLIQSGLVALAAVLFLTGIQWGLPSRASDPFLFGNRTPWTGKEILALAPGWADDANRGADVAAHPLADRDKPIIVNQTDSQRAAIIRRYRLYSDQPDEMITLRALAQMNPSKLRFDPKLYQYGGLWIYPIAATLRGLTPFRLVRLTSDLAFYLDHPEAFGRLYVVMRLYSAAWGLVGVIVMFRLATRISQSQLIGATAAILYMLLPTVINGAHEAKPHLAGAVLGLIAVDFALRAVETEKTSWAIATGIACGAAAGMVLSEWLIIGLLPVMGFCAARRASRRVGVATLWGTAKRRIALTTAACGIALATYCICNPYVVIHLLSDRAVLESNLRNSAAMYQAPPSINGLFHGVFLLMLGGWVTAFFGMFAIIFDLWQKRQVAYLLLAASLPGLCVFLARSNGKPAEYARFALPLELLCTLGAAMGVRLFKRTAERVLAGGVLCAMLLPVSVPYLLSYAHETHGEPTRLQAARQIEAIGAKTIAIDAEPAPYTMPPVNLFDRELVLLPPATSVIPANCRLRLDPVDFPGADSPGVQYIRAYTSPISWAGKPFRLETHGDAAPASKPQP